MSAGRLFASLVVCHVAWSVSLHKFRNPHRDINLVDSEEQSNIEMLIPIVLNDEVEAKSPRDEPFSGLPADSFVLDEPRRPNFWLPHQPIVKKDLSHDHTGPHQRGQKSEEENDTGDASMAHDIAHQVLKILYGELVDLLKSRPCQCSCSSCDDSIPQHRTMYHGNAQLGTAQHDTAQVEHGERLPDAYSLFGPVGGRRDWMVLKEEYPGMMQHYIDSGRREYKDAMQLPYLMQSQGHYNVFMPPANRFHPLIMQISYTMTEP